MKSMDNASSAQLLTKTQAEEFDPVILGGGTGSTLAAWKFAGHGKRVAVIERKYIGGSCPNIACLPSKNIIHSAKIASYSRRGKEFGMACDGFSIDMSGVRDRKRRMVSGLNAMYLEIYRNTGAESAEATGKKSARRYVVPIALASSTTSMRRVSKRIDANEKPRINPARTATPPCAMPNALSSGESGFKARRRLMATPSAKHAQYTTTSASQEMKSGRAYSRLSIMSVKCQYCIFVSGTTCSALWGCGAWGQARGTLAALARSQQQHGRVRS